MSAEPTRPAYGLSPDRRGMILVPALCMVSVLALGTLHISDTALAEIARIGAQTQADAEALEGAIWHAQGMNLLVTINIIMACILAVFVAIRLIVLGLALVLALSVFADLFFPELAPITVQLGRALQTMHRVEDRVAKPVLNALKTCSNTEKIVAAAVPWVAAALPVARLNGDPYAVVLSVSMIPDFEQTFKDWGFKTSSKRGNVWGGWNPRTQFPARLGNLKDIGTIKPESQGPAHSASTSGMIRTLIDKAASAGRRAGNRGADFTNNNKLIKAIDFISGSLPAQEEDFFMVCSRSAQLVAALMTKVLLGPTGLDTHSVETFNSMFGKVMGDIPALACTPFQELSNSVLDQLDKTAKASCAEQKKAWEAGARHSADPHPRTWTAIQQRDCEKAEKKKANDAYGDNTKRDKDHKIDYTKDRASPDEIKTAALWGELRRPRESPLLHVWSVTLHPSWPVAPADSEAEFRHICDTEAHGGNDRDGRSCGDNAMWRYGWYAKTVQLKSLPRELAAHTGDLLQGWANRLMGKAIQGVLERILFFVPKSPSSLPGVGRLTQWFPGAGTVLSRTINNGSGRHAASVSVGDTMRRLFTGVRSPGNANSYWVRKWAGSQSVGALSKLFGGFDRVNFDADIEENLH